jgi:hypothetical protein
MKIASLMLAVLALSACANKDNAVRVTQEVQKPVAAPEVKPAQPMRTEPIFYNGKTYKLKFAPTQGGNYAMSVHGMSAKQQKDATAVATSSLRYFKCKDGFNGILTSGPTYAGDAWKMTAKCG